MRIAPARTRGNAGMTLIEVLVVLAIIGITASVSVLAIGTGGGASGRAEAARLASRLQLAADHAMIESTDLALVPAAAGYSFVQWDAGRNAWQPSRFAGLGDAYRLPSGMRLSSSDPHGVLPIGADAGGRGFDLVLAQKGRSWTIGFDGVTARLRPEQPQAAGGRS